MDEDLVPYLVFRGLDRMTLLEAIIQRTEAVAQQRYDDAEQAVHPHGDGARPVDPPDVATRSHNIGSAGLMGGAGPNLDAVLGSVVSTGGAGDFGSVGVRYRVAF